MSISVHCDECGKTYHVREEMAGRRGKCPRGHSMTVPAILAPAAEENAFAFTSNPMAAEREDDPPAPRSARRRPARTEPEREPAPATDDSDFSAFPTQLAGSSSRDEETPSPKTGRHRRPDRKSGSKEGKPNLMPLILGGILAVLGIGGGATLLVVSRGEAGPLRERAEAADKKAAAAEERAQKAEAFKLAAEAELDKLKKSPPKDPALAEAQKAAKAAEKRATEAEKKLTEAAKGRDAGSGESTAMPAKDLDPNAPGGKNDPVMPGGKLALDPPGKGKEMEKKEMEKPTAKKEVPTNPPAEVTDGPPLGGKNWTAPGGAKFGDKMLKGGDRIWLYPLEDAAPKVENGKLTIKFRWQLRKGKEMPNPVGFGVLIQEAKQTRIMAGVRALSGQSGEAEATFDVKDFKGGLPVSFFVGNGDVKNPIAYSSMLGFQVDFSATK
jgi:hypothetical protein